MDLRDLELRLYAQMRSLLHDYLATDENHSNRAGRQLAAEGNIFHRNQREKNKVDLSLTTQGTL